jgi:CRISPR-associated protein Cas6
MSPHGRPKGESLSARREGSPVSTAATAVIDLAFEVRGTQLPSDYRHGLWLALRAALPWLEDEPLAGVLGIRASLTAFGIVLLSQRSRLTLRLPAARVEAARALQGQRLAIDDDAFVVGAAHERALQPADTLYSHCVVLAARGEAAQCAEIEAALAALQAPCDFMFGGSRTLDAGGHMIHGRALALHGLKPAASLRLQCTGVGAERRLGCGIFVPHKSIAGLDSAADGDEASAPAAQVSPS